MSEPPDPRPLFPVFSHVLIVGPVAAEPDEETLDGIVTDHQWKGDRWIYKVSHLDEDGEGTWDNWYPEYALKVIPES